jgi:hypothetical protein
MNQYHPSSLPSVTAVDIVDLRQVDANRVTEYMAGAINAPAVRRQDQQAQEIAEMWRALPPGDTIRCHTPAVGIRFFDGNVIKCEASICWECENLFGHAEGEPIAYCFDPRSTAGRELFLALQEIIGADVLGDEYPS